MNDKTVAQRVKRFEERRKEQGLKLVRTWVPIEKVDLLKEVAEAIREGKRIVIHDVTSNPDAGTSESD